jgi:hypothetical protein
MMNKLKNRRCGLIRIWTGNSSRMGGSKRQVLPGILFRGCTVCDRKNLIADTKM